MSLDGGFFWGELPSVSNLRALFSVRDDGAEFGGAPAAAFLEPCQGELAKRSFRRTLPAALSGCPRCVLHARRSTLVDPPECALCVVSINTPWK
ncbi:hypothetical protein MRX96_040839 [Rhipicephalus microplus]